MFNNKAGVFEGYSVYNLTFLSKKECENLITNRTLQNITNISKISKNKKTSKLARFLELDKLILEKSSCFVFMEEKIFYFLEQIRIYRSMTINERRKLGSKIFLFLQKLDSK